MQRVSCLTAATISSSSEPRVKQAQGTWAEAIVEPYAVHSEVLIFYGYGKFREMEDRSGDRISSLEDNLLRSDIFVGEADESGKQLLLHHAVVLVEYGYHEETALGYWIIRNSYGEG